MDDRIPARPSHTADRVSTPMFLRIGAVMRLTGLGRSTIYRMMAEHSFPHPVRLSRRRTAWRWSDLDKWRNERPQVSY